MTAALLHANLASAATDSATIAKLQHALATLRADYERRISALEEQLKQQQAATAKTPPTNHHVATSMQGARPASKRPAESVSRFNPTLSLILQGSARHYRLDPESWAFTRLSAWWGIRPAFTRHKFQRDSTDFVRQRG